MSGLAVSKYLVESSPVVDQKDGITKTVLYATRTATRLFVDEAKWKRVRSGDLDDLGDDELENLLAAEVLVPARENELVTILERNRAAIEDDDMCYVVLQPSSRCQLGCWYCGQVHRNEEMSEELKSGIVRDVIRRLAVKDFRKLRICWFGGEALMSARVIRTLSRELMAVADQRGCEYSAQVVTNGLLLTQEIAVELVTKLGVDSIEVTIDGNEEQHDSRRATKSGTPSYATILKNLAELRECSELKRSISVRCNVDAANVTGVSELLDKLASMGLQRFLKYVYAVPLHSWGNEAGPGELTPDVYADSEIGWILEIRSLGFDFPVLPRLRPIVCMAVRPNSVLVDASGELFNCTEVSLVESYEATSEDNPHVPGTRNQYALGRLETGEQVDKRDRLASFNDQVEGGAYPCSDCRMLPVCGGACPKAWLEGQQPCPSTKLNIESRLLLSIADDRLG